MPLTKKKQKNLREAAPKASDMLRMPQPEGRDEELCNDDSFQKTLLDTYKDIDKGFIDQSTRSDELADYWDMYNGKIGQNQYYEGDTNAFVPLTKLAVTARVTKFVNQIFPRGSRYLEATSYDGTMPYAEMALMEYYVGKARLREDIIPTLMRHGDIEGQYNLYVSWKERKRTVAYRMTKPATVLDEDGDELEDPDEDVSDITEETITDGFPDVEVLYDGDVLVLPATADSVDDALHTGGCVTILRRWTKAEVRQRMAAKDIDEDAGEVLLGRFESADKSNDRKDQGGANVDAAGIKEGKRGKYALVYETWMYLTRNKERRLYRAYYGSDKLVLSLKRNPYWCDECPLISEPVEKMAQSFKGKALLSWIKDAQIVANDFANMGIDSGRYSAFPIILTDPNENPRTDSMVYAPAAIWETSPQHTSALALPQMFQQSFEIVAACKTQLLETASVNPASITQIGAKKKLNQAEVSQEQQVDILSVANVIIPLEGSILTPLIHRFMSLDHQFRDKSLTIPSWGQLGVRLLMEEVPPIQMHKRHHIKWFGVEQLKSVQMIQQQIAALNVVRGIPPQTYEGYKLNLVPAIQLIMSNAFGPKLAPLIFEDLRSQLSVEPDIENEMMDDGEEVEPHQFDDHNMHIQAHMRFAQEHGDEHQQIEVHVLKHKKLMLTMAQAAQQPQPGTPGAPGGAGKGLPGQSPPGAQPKPPQAVQGPPGAVSPGQAQGPDAGAQIRMAR